MEQYGIFFLLVINLLLVNFVKGDTLDELKSKSSTAKAKVDAILESIEKKWHVKEFPNFLKSVAMHHTGWEVLKVKLKFYQFIIVYFNISFLLF